MQQKSVFRMKKSRIKKLCPPYFLGDVLEENEKGAEMAADDLRTSHSSISFRFNVSSGDRERSIFYDVSAMHLFLHSIIPISNQNCERIHQILLSNFKTYKSMFKKRQYIFSCANIKQEDENQDQEDEQQDQGEQKQECNTQDIGNDNEQNGQEQESGSGIEVGERGELEDLKRRAAQDELNDIYYRMQIKKFTPIKHRLGKMISNGNIPTYNPPNRRDYGDIIVPGRKGYRKACVIVDTSRSISSLVIETMITSLQTIPFQYDLLLFSSSPYMFKRNMRGRRIEEVKCGCGTLFKRAFRKVKNYSHYLILSDFLLREPGYEQLARIREKVCLVLFHYKRKDKYFYPLDSKIARLSIRGIPFRKTDFIIICSAYGTVEEIRGGDSE